MSAISQWCQRRWEGFPGGRKVLAPMNSPSDGQARSLAAIRPTASNPKAGSSGPTPTTGRTLPPSNGRQLSILRPADESPRSKSESVKSPPWQSTPSSDGKAASNDPNNKSERVNKYKEERRRQLAFKYGDWSSSEDITKIGEEPSYMRFSRRQKKNGAPETSDSGREKTPTQSSANKTTTEEATSPTNRCPDPGGTESGGLVRTNRAARLRAMATNGSSADVPPVSPVRTPNGVEGKGTSCVAPSAEFARAGSLRLRGSASDVESTFLRAVLARRSGSFGSGSSPAAPAPERNTSLFVKPTSQSTTSSDVTETPTGEGADSGSGSRHGSIRRLKDKSNKRKSNLNRALLVEESQPPLASSPALPSTPQPQDHSANQRFHRTRRDGLEKKDATDSPLRSTEIVRSVQHKLVQNETQKKDKVSENDADARKQRQGAMRRPEIPEVFRRFPLERSPLTCLGKLPARDESETEISAAGRIHEMTQLARETTVKVDTLTTAALRSDILASSDSEPVTSKPLPGKALPQEPELAHRISDSPISTKDEKTHVVGRLEVPSGRTNNATTKIVVANRTKSPEKKTTFLKPAVEKKTVTESEDDDDEEYLTPTAESVEKSSSSPVSIHDNNRPTSILKRRGSDEPSLSSSPLTSTTRKRGSLEENVLHEPRLGSPAPVSILRKKSSSDEADEKTISILRSKVVAECEEPASILKKRGSLEEIRDSQERRPILKKRGSFEDDVSTTAVAVADERAMPRPILKSRRKSGEEMEMVEELVESDLRPILKNRRDSDDGARPVSILKSSSSVECYDSSSRPQSILKARSLDVEEKSSVNLRLHREESEERQTPPIFSILKTHHDSDAISSSPPRPSSLPVSSDHEDSDASVVLSPVLLPSILKKRPKEVHPLATPHTEITNLLKAHQKPSERKEAVVIDLPNEGEDGPRKSVAERVSLMESKLEVERVKESGLLTPTLCSLAGSTPPFDSGACTPQCLSLLSASSLSDAQLLSRLEDVAIGPRRFRRDRQGDRSRTQPVTLEEVEESNSLATVQSFRRLVMARASFDAFQQREKEDLGLDLPPADHKTEYPQPFRPRKMREMRERGKRRTLPVTVEELADARREVSPVITKKSEVVEKKDETEGSGSSGEEVLRLSVAAKASLFMKMEAQSSSSVSAVPRRIGAFRRGLQRSQTQPVTTEELHEASKMSPNDAKKPPEPATNAVPGGHQLSKLRSMGSVTRLVAQVSNKSSTSSSSEDDPCQLSLAERVRLFDRKVQEERLSTNQRSPLSRVPGGHRRRGSASRYQTQPVTPEEVEQAMLLKTGPGTPTAAAKLSRSQELTQDGVQATQTESSGSSSLTSSPDEEDGESKNKCPSIEKCRGVETNSVCTDDVKVSNLTQITTTCTLTTGESEENCELELHEAIVHPSRDELSTNVTPMRSHLAVSSNDEDSSAWGSGSGREGKRIKNDAINRRRNAALRRLEDRRSVSCEAPHEAGSPPPGARRRMHQRSNTSPLTKEEKLEAEESTGSAAEQNRKSIRERLEELRKSEEGWKKRVETKEDLEVVSTPPPSPAPVVTAGSPPKQTAQEAQASKVRLRRRSREERPNSITDRISLLAVSAEGWRHRVGDKDSVQFTVAGKMGVEEALQESPVTSDRVRRTPKASIFKSQTADLKELQRHASDSISPHPPLVATVKRSKSMPSKGRPTLSVAASSSDADDPPTMVPVPKVDDESFRSFFGNVSSQQLQSQHFEVSEGGFEEVVSTTHELLVQRRSTRIQNRKSASSRNPLKVLATRTDLQDEYVEVKTGVAEKELRRIKVEQIAKTVAPNKALSAIAGLASKEDFTAVELRKTSNASNPTTQLLPYRDLMLLQVKGRRHVQTRLVAPCVDSINHGDNFILVTPTQVYNWIGEFSNVIERARAAEVTATIQGKKDLGCSSASDVIVVDEEQRTGLEHGRKFFQLLGGDEADVKSAGKPLEDEEYENAIIGTNMAYNVEGDHLVPIESCWGALPRIDVLDATKVLVFDFGSEMYVWHGKKAATDLRKMGVRLARELWERGYDYSECDINPLEPVLVDASIPRVGDQRPAWAVFARVNQHMETVLFREKFLDWPDMSRVIKVKRQESESEKAEPVSPLRPCDAQKMLELPVPAPDLILEGSHVGRGDHYYDAEERRNYDITTRGIKVWHVLEYSHRLLPRESWGQFHSGDTYVVRWHYVITVAGRNLSGQVSRHSFAGRERCAYFFWQGKDSTINEKGASALMTVELDEEKGPHVRVDQGSEPPAFLQLFDGTMVVYQGKREEASQTKTQESSSDSDDREEETSDESSATDEDVTTESLNSTRTWKLFMVRGEVENEVCLVEIRPTMGALRSCSCFLLVNQRSGMIYVWHGAKAPKHTCTVALAAAENLRERRPREVGFDPFVNLCLEEIQEGQEPESFMQGMGHGSVDAYLSHLNSNEPVDYTPRLFYMSSVSGSFEATEIMCSFRCPTLVCPLPFLQTELYKAAQPALFMLDCGHCIFLWQGWWPEATDDNENTATGSAKVRWDVDRRCAMETAIAYCKAKNTNCPPPAYVVSAGLEPLQFTNVFPEWEAREDVAALNAQDGRRHADQPLVQDVLSHLNRMHYTLEELQRRPLPEGVDPSRLESYLDADTFCEVLGMSKDAFYQMPAWKQNDHKKKTVLF